MKNQVMDLLFSDLGDTNEIDHMIYIFGNLLPEYGTIPEKSFRYFPSVGFVLDLSVDKLVIGIILGISHNLPNVSDYDKSWMSLDDVSSMWDSKSKCGIFFGTHTMKGDYDDVENLTTYPMDNVETITEAYTKGIKTILEKLIEIKNNEQPS